MAPFTEIALRTRARVFGAAAVLLVLALSGCFGSDRSAAAVCRVWDTDGRALHDQLGYTPKTANDLPGALANLAGAPGRVADLMDSMAAVAPSDIEPSFKTLADAFRQVGASESAGDPLSALAGGLAAGVNAQGAVAQVNAFLASNCGTPSR
jgi:hypothetical protein